MKKVVLGPCTLILGKCEKVMDDLDPKWDSLVTDPPYELDSWSGGSVKWPLKEKGMGWDKRPDWLVSHALGFKHVIIWGGNYFELPPARGWLVWDKIVKNFTSGHCELAWTNLDQPIRRLAYSHGELATEGKKHPTQKPLPLMKWCLEFLPRTAKVCDPFMGSGTTGVACVRMGMDFIGVEQDKEYFEIACKRIEKALRQPKTLF